MTIDLDALPIIFGWAILLFSIYLFLYYKFIYSIMDPLFSWVFATSFASVLAIQVIPNLQDILHFFGCQLSLWIGFFVAYKQYNYQLLSSNVEKKTYCISDQSLLIWTTYLLLVVYILSNLFVGYSKGFALLSDTPTESKIANFQEGFGFFRKINWSIGTFVGVSLVYMYLLKRRKKDLLFIMIVVFFSSLDGSKSALLKILFSAGIVFYHPIFADKQNLIVKFKRYVPIVLVGAMGIVFTVLLKENDSLENAFFAFIKRLLYSADSILYYYQPVNVDYFAKFSFWDYPYRLINPILGFLRIQPYEEAIGNIMVDNLRLPGSISSVTVGPNAPFYIEGRIYFYFWSAFPFSMLIGYLYAIIRIKFFLLFRTSAFFFVYMASFCQLSNAMISDVNLAITQLFDLSFFVIPPYIMVSFLLTRRIRLHPMFGKFVFRKKLSSSV